MAYTAGVSFPGISNIVEFNGTLSHGITPSVFRLTITPQPGIINTKGTLLLTWNTGAGVQTLAFNNCIIDTGSGEYNSSGYLVSLSILDRRWKWKYGMICSRRNIPDASGEDFISPTTPRALANLCLDALGETGYDTNDLPNTTPPHIRADWDYANPAQCLQEICDELGYRVVLRLNGTVAVRKAGSGAVLPGGPRISISTEVDPPERPDYITVVTGKTRFQYDFPLVAVGQETDGKIKDIEDLSYEPAGGWVLGDETEFLELANEEICEHAKKCIFKWYRVDAEGVQLPVFASPISSRSDVIEVFDEQNSVVDEDGIRPRDAWVYGVWYRENDRESGNTGNGTTVAPVTGFADDQIVDRSWSYDEKRKIIKFSQAVFILNPDKFLVKPSLRVRLAFYASEPNKCRHRVTRTRDMRSTWGTNGTNEFVIYQDHLVPTYTASFGADFTVPNTTWSNNLTDINAFADKYIDEEVARINNRLSGAITYAGLMLNGFDLDGAITQVSWQIMTTGSSTKIFRNNDPGSETTVGYEERRIWERQRVHKNQLARQKKVGDIEPQKLVIWE